MAAEQSPRDSFRAGILAKIAAWQAVLASYDAAVSLDGSAGESDGGEASSTRNQSGKAMDLPVGVFRDKSLREAIEILLSAGRRKQTNKEIALGLQKGGIATTATNFEATVATALGRMKDDGAILRFPDGWDLASSYPDSLRSRLEKDAKPKSRGKAKKKSAKQEKAKAQKVKPVQPEKAAKSQTVDSRVLDFLVAAHPHSCSAAEIAKTINESDKSKMALAFARLARHNKVSKGANGEYTATAAALSA